MYRLLVLGMKFSQFFRGIFLQVFLHNCFVKFVGFALLYKDCILRAVTETGTETITEILCEQFRLTVDNLDCAFGTGRHTETTAVTFIFVYGYDLTDHGVAPLFVK